jgi:co-chaperonin GroES (HSP10)
MTPLSNRILVKFEENIETPLNLIIPERYVVHEQGDATDNETRTGVTTDRRLINPQNVTILSGEHTGRTAFVYYGSYEVAKWIDGNALIPDHMLLFFTNPIEMMPETYLGDEIFIEGDKTPSGIYTTPVTEQKDGIRIRLTHVPENCVASAGDTVITMDDKQYWLIYGGQRMIKLRESEIVAVVRDEEIIPTRDNLLIEYLPDPDEEKRMAENEKIYNHMDFARKHNWHIEGMQFKPVPEPMTIHARILKGKHEGCECIVFRKYGVSLPNKQWIIARETLIAIVQDRILTPVA